METEVIFLPAFLHVASHLPEDMFQRSLLKENAAQAFCEQGELNWREKTHICIRSDHRSFLMQGKGNRRYSTHFGTAVAKH